MAIVDWLEHWIATIVGWGLAVGYFALLCAVVSALAIGTLRLAGWLGDALFKDVRDLLPGRRARWR